MVTIEDTILFPIILSSITAALTLLIFLFVLRRKHKEGSILKPFMNLLFGVILVFPVLAAAITSHLLVVVIGSVFLSILSFTIVLCLRRTRLWSRYLAIGITLGLFLLLFCFTDPAITLSVIVMIILASISVLILFVIVRIKHAKLEILSGFAKLRIGYIFTSVAIGSAMSLFLSCFILRELGENDISSIIQSLNKSNRLLVWNSFPIFSGEEPWGTEEIEITDRGKISCVSEVVAQIKYKIRYSFGVFSTKDALEVKIYSDEQEIGKFFVISNTVYFNSKVMEYIPDDLQLLTHLRETIGANLGG